MKMSAKKGGHIHVARSLLTFLMLLFLLGNRLSAQVTPEVSKILSQASESMRQGDLDAAGDGFAAAAKLAPAFAEAHFNLGLVREEQGRLDEAITSFQKALALKPRLHGANLFLGVAHYKLNHYDQAVPAVRKETEAYPKDASAWMWLGVIELAKDEPEKAAAALDKAAQLAPDNADILYHRGQAHLLVSRSSYERMFKEDPKSGRVHEVLGQIDSDAERYNDAIYEYLEAIKLAPTQPGLHEELGAIYRRAMKADEADAAFQTELEINPHNALARYERGVLAMERGDGAKGKELIEAAISEKRGLPHADYNLGRAEKLLGNDAAAVAHLEKAIASDSDPEIVEQAWYQLGTLYRRLHRPEDSQKALTIFQKLKDESTEASHQALTKLKNRQNPNAAEPPPEPEKPRYP
jgi:tetratricopeptide (TPR) repeat protein